MREKRRFGVFRQRRRPRSLLERGWFIASMVLGYLLVTLAFRCAQRPVPPPASPRPVASAGPYSAVKIEGVPHVLQRPDFCGEACVEMFLRKLGKTVDQNQVFDVSGLDPALGRGVHTSELVAALQNLGFQPGKVDFPIAAAKASEDLEEQWKILHADLLQGIPSIACTHFDESPKATEHFRLVLGYDPTTDEVLYHDPALDKGSYLRLSRSRLFALWPLKYSQDTWTVIRIRLQPGEIKEPPARAGITSADLAQQVMTLREKRGLPKGFTVVAEPPFVVVGDGPAAQVVQHAQDVVRWTVRMLKKDFFTKDPERVLEVWLFKDAASYERNARRIFHQTPTTPYGYYSDTAGALIMNIATGGGTLVHEIVHPFLEANFPKVPPWLNEGMGSLYEQAAERNGHIVGLTNWRLAGLQAAIKQGAVPPFEHLLALNRAGFYDADRGTNYAQSRYLCYYLQERGLFVPFYHEFLRNHASDPTGEQTLKRVLGEEDLGKFKRTWEAFVLGLRFQSN